MENTMMVLKILKIELPYDPAISVLGIYPKNLKQGLEKVFVHPTHDHWRIIHNSQEVKATWMSLSMNKRIN